MYNFTNHDVLRKCQRSFDVDTPLDSGFVNLMTQKMNEFISTEMLDINSFIITDRNEIKLLHASAIYEYEPPGLIWKTNTQVLAPMVLMCFPNKNKDIMALAKIGRMQARLGLLAIEHGYQTGYCLCFNSRVMAMWSAIKKYAKTDPISGSYIRPITLSIGRPLDPTKPYNWSYSHNRSNPSHNRSIDNNIILPST
jgi:hypothetical protein